MERQATGKLVDGQDVFLIWPNRSVKFNYVVPEPWITKNVNKGNKERDNPKHGAQETIIKLIYSL